MPRPKQITLTLQTPALNNICADQTTAGAGDFLINGSLAFDGAVSVPTAQRIDIESIANISGVTFTITGIDQNGNAISEEIAGPNATTVTTTGYFKSITQVAVSGAVGTNTSLGFTDEAISPTYPMNRYNVLGSVIATEITGTINYDVAHTNNNLQDGSTTDWATDSAGALIDTEIIMANPVSGVRVVVNSYTAGATCRVNILQN